MPQAMIHDLFVAGLTLAITILAFIIQNKIKEGTETTKKLAFHDECLKHDKKVIDEQQKLDRALCHSILALLSHSINGNSIDKLKKAEEDLKNYLVEN